MDWYMRRVKGRGRSRCKVRGEGRGGGGVRMIVFPLLPR